MKRIAVPFDSLTEAAIADAAAAAGTTPPIWIAGVVREHMLAEACRLAAAYDAEHDDPEWEAARLEGRA